MKKINLKSGLIFTLTLFVCLSGLAQNPKVRREARALKKQGYHVLPGSLPLEIQLKESYGIQQEKDENNNKKYIIFSQKSVGETQIAAQKQALSVAKTNIAGLISSKIAELVENNIANVGLSKSEATSVTKTVSGSKNIIAQVLGRTQIIFEVYRDVGNNIEANITIAYSEKTALENAKKSVRQKLEEETNILQDKLDKLLDSN